MIHATLHRDLKFFMRSARRQVGAQLLDKKMKTERVKVCEAVMAMMAVAS
jgi:hypothetical protein